MTNAKTDRDGLFRKFNIFQILMGARIYKFNIFYEIKDILLKYDDQYDYINFGYWSQGDATANPSAELVSRIASNLELTLEDIVLNAGSGLGQPDIDIVREFHPRKIIGINIIEEQVEYANEKAASEGLSGVIEHRTLDAGDISEELKNEHITCVISVEGICEFPNAGKFFQDCHSLLPEGGRVSFSDFVSVKSSRGLLERWIGRIFKSITTFVYGDNWRLESAYRDILENAGFENIMVESCGETVFPYIARHAATQYPLLAQKRIPFFLRKLAYWQIVSLNTLFRWGEVDYKIISATKAAR